METTASSSSVRATIWSNRNFLLLWTGQSVSLLGDALFNLALVVWVVTTLVPHKVWAPLAVSGVLVAETAPVLLIGPLAGVFTDRWDKRRTLIAMDLLRALLMGLLILVVSISPLPFLRGDSWLLLQLLLLYSIVFLSATCSQFFSPARLALLGDVVTEEQRVSAFSLQQVTQSLTTLVGPPLAVPLLFGVGIRWLLFINALSFCVSFLAIALMRVAAQPGQPQQQRHFRKEFVQGVRFAFQQQMLRNLLLGIFIAALGGGAINALNIFFVTQNLHAPVAWLGFLDALFGVGILAGAILMGRVAQRVGLELAFASAILAIGLGLVVLSRITNLWFAFVILVLLGIAQGTLSVISGPLMLGSTPRELLGRVVSVMNPLPVLASLISASLAGYLVSTVLHDLHLVVLGITLGPIDTLFMGAGGIMALAGLYLLKSRSKGKLAIKE